MKAGFTSKLSPSRHIKPEILTQGLQFLPLRDFDDVTSALNFNTPDCHVVGGCDLYTTKAAGSDKKLYRNIENSLESQYESLLRLSASFSPPQSSAPASLDLSRSSPFGPLSQISSRRTFAYLIATLNASHPDYDFSHILRPTDFRRERSLKAVMNNIDSTMYNLRPSPSASLELPPPPKGASAAPASQAWGPRMWTVIDKEMTLKECSVYCWSPEESEWDGEEGSIWSVHYLFFNKARKRVAYIYVRGIPIMTHSPRLGFPKRSASGVSRESGANKRARYWLGDKADNATGHPDDDDIERKDDWTVSEEFDLNNDDDDFISDLDVFSDDYDDEADDEDEDQDLKAPVRGVSEEVAAEMEI
ncbi:RNA polymerase III-inhibiting protein maf1 [Pseudogymnoascus destructans]|uniref:Repressor of RNA polymerase III transcription MAF1 n=1 Tax=Pseudogymnoascus destructans TaxID=655981 RepID=A0A177A175_9PEZI|nr:RNA polymerase III-inhibiting protein maf1 [Pseudogymnoascus destructans]OAF55031.1 RNA polymerase III-inhibiting protein maf1 [Pseudogymnoascus destructans]